MEKREVTGQGIVNAIVARLTDKNIRCYDTAIVKQLQKLTGKEVLQLFHFGDTTKWHNERILGEIQ